MTLERLTPGAANQHSLIERYQQTREQHGAGETGPRAAAPQAGRAADQAEISSQARDLIVLRRLLDAGRSAVAALPEAGGERLEAVRERIASGFYQSAEVREQVAGRLGSLLLAQDLF
jgi:hypothetical protein